MAIPSQQGTGQIWVDYWIGLEPVNVFIVVNKLIEGNITVLGLLLATAPILPCCIVPSKY